MVALLSHSLPFDLMRERWASTLNPVLANPVISGNILTDVKLIAGSNTINHKLGQKLQGYIVVMNSAPATFYDLQATNQHPELTLVLNSSQATTVSLYVF